MIHGYKDKDESIRSKMKKMRSTVTTSEKPTRTAHIDQITPNIYLGDAVAAGRKNLLARKGVTHVL